MGVIFNGRYVPGGRIRVRNPYKAPQNPQSPEWTTPTGYLGSWNEGTEIDYELVASDPNGDITDYQIVSGAPPRA